MEWTETKWYCILWISGFSIDYFTAKAISIPWFDSRNCVSPVKEAFDAFILICHQSSQ